MSEKSKEYWAITSGNGTDWRVLAIADTREEAEDRGFRELGPADASDAHDQTARVNFRVVPRTAARAVYRAQLGDEAE